jgi:hypothetical protein
VVVVAGAVVVVVAGAVVVVVAGAVVVVVAGAVVVVVAGATMAKVFSTVGLVAVGVHVAVMFVPEKTASATIEVGAFNVRVWPPVPARTTPWVTTFGMTMASEDTPAPVKVMITLLPCTTAEPMRFGGVGPLTKSTVTVDGSICAGMGVVISTLLMATVMARAGTLGTRLRETGEPATSGSGDASVVRGACAPAVMPRLVAHDKSRVTVCEAALDGAWARMTQMAENAMTATVSAARCRYPNERIEKFFI